MTILFNFIAVLLCTFTSYAEQNAFRVVARVNDHAITALDVEDRVKFLILSSNMQVPEDAMKRFRTQVVNALVEEELRIQEATKKSVTVEPAEIQEVMSNLEKQNNLQEVGLKTFLTQNAIRPSTLENQIKANILWKKVVAKEYGPRLTVSPQEVTDDLERIKKNLGQEQFFVSEIKLIANTANQKAEIKDFANRLVSELRAAAKDDARPKAFDSYAHQFSHSSTALQGGDLGWVSAGSLKPQMMTALKSMAEGDISAPLSDRDDEIVILYLKGKRSPDQAAQWVETIGLQQILVTVDDKASFDQMSHTYERLKTLKASLKSPDDLKDLSTRIKDATVRDLGQVDIRSLPEEVQTQLATLKENQVTDPTRLPGGIAMFMCGKKDKVDASMPTRDLVEQQIKMRRLEAFERRYLRDIHSQASIQLTA